MLGQLPPSCYFDPAVFAAERERLFGRLWIFAGLTHFLAAPDSFITREIAGRRVVIQNFAGSIKAFENVCLHRGKLIQTEACGTRPLVCGYHGWRYDSDGRVATIPFEEACYGFPAADRQRLCLREFAVHIVGALVFVNVGERAMPFDQQFRPALQEALASASAAFDDEVLVARWRKEFNWKLAYENLRDMVHPRFVHTQSLSLSIKFPLMTASEVVADPGAPETPIPDLRDLSYGGAEGEILRDRPPAYSDWVSRWGDTNAYFNWLLYPNTHILAADGGYSFSIEHHHPVSATATEITAYYMTARKRRPVAWLAATLWEMAKAAKRILDEDTDVMEDVQRALGAASRPVLQGRAEMQNRRTDRWYVTHVLDDAAECERE